MEVESQLKANKVEIENRQHSIQDLQKRIGEYQGRLNMTPMREQQMAELTRNYEQSRKNYEELLAKLDQVGDGDRSGEDNSRASSSAYSIPQTFRRSRSLPTA